MNTSMNLPLNSVTTRIDADSDDRKATYRLAMRLLLCIGDDPEKALIGEKLGYHDAELLDSDILALTKIIIQVQRAFGEADIPGRLFGMEATQQQRPAEA